MCFPAAAIGPAIAAAGQVGSALIGRKKGGSSMSSADPSSDPSNILNNILAGGASQQPLLPMIIKNMRATANPFAQFFQ